MTSEVLVIGGGPAGSLTALLLARAGMRVRLFERAQCPRDKLCGDTVNPGAWALLGALGVADPIARVAKPIGGMVVTGLGRARVEGVYGPGIVGMALRRRVLDELLLQTAAAAGVAVETGVRVDAPLMDDDRVTGVRAAAAGVERRVTAPLVVAADGRHSRLAFGLGLSRFAARPQRWAYGATYADVTGLGDRGEMHVREDGYVGIAPLPDGTANVCVVREWHRAAAPLRGDVLAQAIAADGLLRERFVRATRLGAATILGPLAVDSRAAGVPGLLLAGDAAGFVDPMTGDGMRFAIRGAELAAEAALRELATGQPAWAWLTAARQREFSAKWRLNRALRGLVAWPAGVRAASALAAAWSAPLVPLIPLAGDVPLARRLAAAAGRTGERG
ncbi:MAG: NAD(P)/FAD-dependent oxidoreductase [Alphaproteobacteria bacterium]